MVRVLARQGVGFARRPLDVVFGAPSHAAVLRAVARRPAGATGGELARAAGVAHQATLDALGRLEEAGLVTRLPMGRGYMFRLNREHRLVERGLLPLLREEEAFGRALRESLAREFEKVVASGLLFGSTARGEERPRSDLDLCLIVRRPSGKERALERAAALADPLRRRFGVRLSPIVFTVDEFLMGVGRKDPLIMNIRNDGERIMGKPIEEIRRG